MVSARCIELWGIVLVSLGAVSSGCGGRYYEHYEADDAPGAGSGGAPMGTGAGGVPSTAGTASTGTGGKPSVVSMGGAPGLSCEMGQRLYPMDRAQLVMKYQSAYADLQCFNDDDCALTSEMNACVASCGVSMLALVARSFSADLTVIAAKDCSSCEPPPTIACKVAAPRCVGGNCI